MSRIEFLITQAIAETLTDAVETQDIIIEDVHVIDAIPASNCGDRIKILYRSTNQPEINYTAELVVSLQNIVAERNDL